MLTTQQPDMLNAVLYKEMQKHVITTLGYIKYDKYDLKNTPARELPKHVLDFLYGKCLQSRLSEFNRHIESVSEVTQYGSDYYGWNLITVVNNHNILEIRAYNLDVTLTYKPTSLEELKAFMEVLQSLEYEVGNE